MKIFLGYFLSVSNVMNGRTDERTDDKTVV